MPRKPKATRPKAKIAVDFDHDRHQIAAAAAEVEMP
jgi:hypothetical protein